MRESNQKYLKNNYQDFRKLANHDDDHDDALHYDCEMKE
jgi:hypothetical protein